MGRIFIDALCSISDAVVVVHAFVAVVAIPLKVRVE